MTATILQKANQSLEEIANEIHALHHDFTRKKMDRLTYTDLTSLSFLEHYQDKYPTEFVGRIYLKSPIENDNSYDKYVTFIGNLSLPINQTLFSYHALLKQFPDLIIFDPIISLYEIDMKKNVLCAYFSRARVHFLSNDKDPSLNMPEFSYEEDFLNPLGIVTGIPSLHSSFFPSRSTSPSRTPRNNKATDSDLPIPSMGT